jgi:enamine deaminase RidA (YjgF/YER057c/UK114 family)
MDDAEVLRRLADEGIELPSPPRALAAYVPARRAGDLVFLAGQVPLVDGEVLHPGRLGDDVTVDQGREAAARAAVQALAALRAHLGTLEPLRAIVQVTVYVAAAPTFAEHPAVANGASELLGRALGEAGEHARAAVGVASLPLGASVEVALTAHVG